MQKRFDQFEALVSQLERDKKQTKIYLESQLKESEKAKEEQRREF